MSGFELELLDSGAMISLTEGQTRLGRGGFLRVGDRRISRQHGLLDITDGQLRIKSTHENPCFFQSSLEDTPVPLERDRWYDLQPGNLFSLLPGKFVYRVVFVNGNATPSNSQGFEEEEPIACKSAASAKLDEKPPSSPELNGRSEPTQSNSQNLPVESTSACLQENEEDDKMEVAATEEKQESRDREPGPAPVQKKRVLPAWMMQVAPDVSGPSTSTAFIGDENMTDTELRKAGDRKRGRGKAPPTPAKKPRPRKTRDISVSSEGSEQSDIQPAPKKRAKRLRSEEEEEEDMPFKAATEPETSPTGGPSVDEAGGGSEKEKGQRNGGRAPDARQAERRKRTDGESENQSQPEGQGRTGRGQEVAEQQQEVVEQRQEEGGTEGGGASASRAGSSQPKVSAPPRTPCPYGKSCYRKNPLHFQECSHPGDKDYVEREDEEDKEGDDDRPECPYGTACYRKNPQHKMEYKHTQDPGKKGGVKEEEEEEEEEEWDDDSFINDDSGDEDSDYVPPDSEDEDITRLKKEAQNFLKRKR